MTKRVVLLSKSLILCFNTSSPYTCVQDGASRFGISLGVFSNEKGARERLAELRTQGVRSAVAAPRPGKDDSATLQARGPAKRRSEVLAAAGRLLPAGEPQACK